VYPETIQPSSAETMKTDVRMFFMVGGTGGVETTSHVNPFQFKIKLRLVAVS